LQSVEEDAGGGTIDLPLGEVFEIRLRENPMTGFRWNLVTDGAPGCALIHDNFMPGSTVPGQGGVHSWRFRGLHAGGCVIELHHGRPWERGESAGRPFILHVRVKQP
jgi:predicted secreted protein